ncbi:hypothetical protein [Sphingomonas sp. LHG3443-2]|uniref:hypothetical protein n=1 Tax=Sphingomonas sp. LHG3443-2 TaxID=2804639 RepID=UPI003CF3E115
MKGKVALYALFLALVAAGVWWWEGSRTPQPRNLVAALLLLPLFAFVLWLKIDWAPEQASRRQLAKEGGATTKRSASDEITDAAERP